MPRHHEWIPIHAACCVFLQPVQCVCRLLIPVYNGLAHVPAIDVAAHDATQFPRCAAAARVHQHAAAHDLAQPVAIAVVVPPIVARHRRSLVRLVLQPRCQGYSNQRRQMDRVPATRAELLLPVAKRPRQNVQHRKVVVHHPKHQCHR